MSIFVGKDTRLLVQGITGREGSYHTVRCMDYGTKVVAGVTPGKGGQIFAEKVPIYDTVQQAAEETKANTSLVFVPPPFAGDAIIEAIDAGIQTVICITEGIPVSDSIKVCEYASKSDARLLGPNCPGIISPKAKVKAGIMPSHVYSPGRVGVVSRSGTLTYEAVGQLTPLGIGQSTCVGIGGDPVSGSDFVDVLELFQKDEETDAIVMIGEIGGTKEQEAAEFIHSNVSKPVISLIVGQTAPRGRRMGHAGAIVTGSAALASSKVKSLEKAGAFIVPSPADIGTTTLNTLAQL